MNETVMADDELLDVLIIGAGFAGVCAAIKLKQAGINNIRIYEKADGVGGTWWNNTYPGAACDIPSHFYCFSFEPNPNWTRLFSPQPEIQSYIEHCVDKYGLRPHLHLGRKVHSMAFDEGSATWHTVFEDGESVRSRFVINGSGGLHQPKTPEFDGADRFAGTAMHTANWDSAFDPVGKDIAIIGSAASAIQVLPAIAPLARSVSLYQRTPNYIVPRKDFAYPDRWKRLFARFPILTWLHRQLIFYRLELLLYPIVMRESFRAKRAEEAKRYIKVMTRGRKTRAAMVPTYEMGCKRILISDDFFDALNRDNVELVTEPIDHMTESGIVGVEGNARSFDAIVYATGFDLEGHLYSIDISGAGGLSLRQAWKDGAEAYRGVMVPGFPNYFMVTGPNTGVGTTSVVFMIEQTVGWIMKCIKKAGKNKTVSVTMDATAAYNRQLQSTFPDTVWASGCQSWYRKSDGSIETLYPHNARAFRRQMRRVDRRHIHFTAPAKQASKTLEAAQ
ncbi:flavin-containing monooxygenase [Hoeflea sp. TYP-13]|uniref:flavin-containing monooxygenase n=1 Tax=Hoeflea sp. TYP-13 TaxID=3230023 RepID=UPI0034C685D4